MGLVFWHDWYRYEGRFFDDPNDDGLTINFDRDVSQMMNEEEEEDVLSPELERLIAQEEREMKPHQAETELINLETSTVVFEFSNVIQAWIYDLFAN